MKRQIRTQNFIIWYEEDGREDYTIIPARNITEAKEQAEDMFGEATTSVEFYNP